MMDSSGFTLSTAILVAAIFVLTTVNVVHGEKTCINDRDCSSDQFCYNTSGSCTFYIVCSGYNRLDGLNPARQAFECGSCLPGFTANSSQEYCKKITVSKGTQTEPEDISEETNWFWLWIALGLALFAGLIFLAMALKKCYCSSANAKFCTKMVPWSTRPTAPPQDEATYHLRDDREERPPIYSSVIGANIDKDFLVNAVPSFPPDWVAKPNYDPDLNDNVADGVAMRIQSPSTNIQMDLEVEEETNPSSWTPGQLTVDVPSRPFARFAMEQQDNMLVGRNCSENSRNDGSSSDDDRRIPEEPSGSRAHGDTFCGPNVQINQTITLNIASNDSK